MRADPILQPDTGNWTSDLQTLLNNTIDLSFSSLNAQDSTTVNPLRQMQLAASIRFQHLDRTKHIHRLRESSIHAERVMSHGNSIAISGFKVGISSSFFGEIEDVAVRGDV